MKHLTLQVTGLNDADGAALVQYHPGAEYCGVVTNMTRDHEANEQMPSPGRNSYGLRVSISQRVMKQIDACHEHPDFRSEMVAPACEYWCAVY